MISCGIIENFSSRMQLFYTGRKEVKGFVKFFIYQGPMLDLFFSNAGHRINSHEYEKAEDRSMVHARIIATTGGYQLDIHSI